MDSTSGFVGVVSCRMIVRCLLAAAVLAEVFAVAQQEKLQALDRVLEIVAEVAEYLVARSIFIGSHSRFIYP